MPQTSCSMEVQSEFKGTHHDGGEGVKKGASGSWLPLYLTVFNSDDWFSHVCVDGIFGLTDSPTSVLLGCAFHLPDHNHRRCQLVVRHNRPSIPAPNTPCRRGGAQGPHLGRIPPHAGRLRTPGIPDTLAPYLSAHPPCPQIPNEVTDYYLQRVGFDCEDVRL